MQNKVQRYAPLQHILVPIPIQYLRASELCTGLEKGGGKEVYVIDLYNVVFWCIFTRDVDARGMRDLGQVGLRGLWKPEQHT